MSRPEFIPARVIDCDAPQWAQYGLPGRVTFVLTSGLSFFPNTIRQDFEYQADIKWLPDGNIGYVRFTAPNNLVRVTDTSGGIYFYPTIIVGAQVLGMIDNSYNFTSKEVAA
jgi:hypothetical protein